MASPSTASHRSSTPSTVIHDLDASPSVRRRHKRTMTPTPIVMANVMAGGRRDDVSSTLNSSRSQLRTPTNARKAPSQANGRHNVIYDSAMDPPSQSNHRLPTQTVNGTTRARSRSFERADIVRVSINSQKKVNSLDRKIMANNVKMIRQDSSSDSSSSKKSPTTEVMDIIRPASRSSTPDDRDQANRPCNKFGFFVDSPEAGKLKSDAKQHDEASSRVNKLNRKREKKWMHMLQHWDVFINKKWKKVRDRCRKGIPHPVRGRAWLHLVGGHNSMKRHPNGFVALAEQPGSEHIIDEIKKDLHRQFPSHELFASRSGPGQADLFRILKAFSILKPDIGYCQGQAPIAAVLLMHMPAEEAFWSLVAICDHYLPGYFAPGLEAVQLHGDMLQSLVKKHSPAAYKLLKKQKIEPVLYMTEWFMCVFARTLPWTLVLRVWDMFLCEGIKVVFKVGIELLDSQLGDLKPKRGQAMHETLELLRRINDKKIDEELMLNRVLRMDLSDSDLQREHNVQEAQRRKNKIRQAKQRIS